jgi:hypothetical protein
MDEPRTEQAPPGGQTPPSWEDFVRENGRRAGGERGPIPDFTPLIAIVEALRRAIPHELQEQFNALQRELLLTLRALIDWYLDRLDKPELAPQVEDIPIE